MTIWTIISEALKLVVLLAIGAAMIGAAAWATCKLGVFHPEHPDLTAHPAFENATEVQVAEEVYCYGRPLPHKPSNKLFSMFVCEDGKWLLFWEPLRKTEERSL